MLEPKFKVVFARYEADLEAAQRLRYDVFVNELGGDGALVDHEKGLEKDRYDPYAQHLLLLDLTRGATRDAQIVGVYRLLDRDGAALAGGFYSQDEFDLSAVLSSEKQVLELGRSCVHKDYRSGTAMYHLWSALAAYVFREKFDILFGTASFSGTDVAAFHMPLKLLQDRHLAPEPIRPIAKEPCVQLGDFASLVLDRKAAMTQMPSLIKAYLRLGGCVGAGAYVDHAFNTTDVCLILDIHQISDKQRRLYERERVL